jgi:Flp pilus assembly protein TadG
MTYARLKSFLLRFRDGVQGTITVEAVVIVPILFWALQATFEIFEMYRFKSVREKATYTVTDMISREQAVIDQPFLDGAKQLFDEFTNGVGENQLRVTVVTFDTSTNEYSVVWSQIRGTGPMNPLQTSDVATDHDSLPTLGNGRQLIIVESWSNYEPRLNAGFDPSVPVTTRVFTGPRFVENIQCPSCAPSS